MTLAEEKRALRKRALARRREAAERDDRAALGVKERFLAAFALEPGAVVSGYWPFRDELDPRPLMHALNDAGQRCALPVMEREKAALTFRAWSPEVALEEGAYGIPVPPEDAPRLVPEVLLVPLLAFDRKGCRLGYGGGYYDRTLAALRAKRRIRAVGLAYAAQEEKCVPHGPRDQRLDLVLTERETIAASAA
jgi:5-formyltetrahydrofolate cyclo-ligase